MIKCDICQKEFEKLTSLGKHIGFKHTDITLKNYYDTYMKKEGEGICNGKDCKNEVNFVSLKIGYNRFCSHKCSTSSVETQNKMQESCLKKLGVKHPIQSTEIKNKIKNTCLKKYGVDHSSKTRENRRKFAETCQERYGVDNVFQLEEAKEKSRKTCLEKYGVEYIGQFTESREKAKKTWLKKYGVEYPSQSKEIREKIKKVWLEKYGVDHPCKSKETKEKIKNTCLEKYGVKYTGQVKEIREKIEQTNLERYGAKCILQIDKFKEKIQKTNLERHGVKYIGQSTEVRKKIEQTNLEKYGFRTNLSVRKTIMQIKEKNKIKFYNCLLNSDRLKKLVKPNFTLEEYKIATNTYSWICCKCNTVFEDNITDGKIPRCPQCFPKLQGTSKSEQEIAEFLKYFNLDIIQNDRSIIPSKEIDIFIPSHNLAIEFDGLYWHSELSGHIPPDYHFSKTLECQKKGIQLIHVFEDEWVEKPNVVKSIIKSKLGLIKNKIFARKCEVGTVDSHEARDFLDNNHLQGFINGKHIGIYHNYKLVSVMSYGKPRFNKNYETEILRFCSQIDTIVVGGLSKLLNYINSKSILTYVDRRYGEGKGYEKVGFKKVGESTPNYFYMKEYQNRTSRVSYQKHKLKDKLEIFDENLTEWQNMQLNGYDRIWDCGNLVFSLTA